MSIKKSIDKFPCIECGLCCGHAKEIEHLKNWVNETGRCKYLKNDNLCKIYDKRPLLCNVEESYSKIFYKIMSKKDFYIVNLQICIELNQKFGTKDNCEILKTIYHNLELNM